MAGIPVPIAGVIAYPASTAQPGRTRHRVTLACGCHWWQDVSNREAPPQVGAERLCFGTHAPGRAGLPVEWSA